ncbi:MAG: hypothetical protein WCB80_25755, partial [Mycobacterium sp.]
MRSPERSWRLIDDALKTARGARRQQLLVFRANQLALAARPVEVVATMADVDHHGIDYYGATMGYAAQSMAYGELGQPDQAAAKAFEADEALTLSDQGKFRRQTFTEFHTFALVAAGRIAEAIEVAEENLRAQREEPADVRALAAQI